jgi:hypothetical protein
MTNPRLILVLILSCFSWALAAHTNPKTRFRVNLREFYDTTRCDAAHASCDFRDAMKNALTHLYDNGGGTLEINPGRYRVCTTVDIGPRNGPASFDTLGVIPTLTIKGTGGESEATTLYCDGKFDTAGVKKPAFLKFRMPMAGYNKHFGVRIEHLAISGEGSGSSLESVTGVYTENRTSTILHDVRFLNLRKGVWIQYGGRYLIDYCKFSRMGEYAIDGSQAGDAVVSRCEFAATGQGAARNRSAAVFAGGNTNIRDNVFGTSWNAAIKLRQGGRFEGSDVIASGELSVVNNEFDANKYVMVFDSAATGDSITNCEFSGNKVAGWTGYPGTNFAGATDVPIMAGYMKGRHIAGLMVKNNRFAGLSLGGIGFDFEYGKDIQITGNSFSQYWSYTRQYILGTLFRLGNSSQINISDNKAELGWAPKGAILKPVVAEFANAEGAFRNNTFNGHGGGIVQDAAARMDFSGNIGSPDYRSVFNDAAGWPTIPNASVVLDPVMPGGGALRKCGYVKSFKAAFPSDQWSDLVTLRIPSPGTPNASSVGGIIRFKTHVRQEHAGAEYSAVFLATLAVSDLAGKGDRLKYEIRDTLNLDPRLDWGSPRFSFSSPVAGKGYREVTIRFKAASPGKTGFQVRMQAEYEEWGGLKLN